jgi:hypothetical protein
LLGMAVSLHFLIPKYNYLAYYQQVTVTTRTCVLKEYLYSPHVLGNSSFQTTHTQNFLSLVSMGLLAL